jgi:hypothetical protein
MFSDTSSQIEEKRSHMVLIKQERAECKGHGCLYKENPFSVYNEQERETLSIIG